jgi:amino acid adenylation domain-containing protein
VDHDPSSLPAVLRVAAGRHGDRVALTAAGFDLTYRQLHAAVCGLAADFAAAGLRPGDLVGLAVEAGPLPLILSAALMRAGCGYVPLDLRHPVARLQHIVSGAGLRAAVCDEAGRDALRQLPVSTVVVDTDDVRHAATTARPGTPPPEPAGDAVAYVMFTSGSSGLPKGVAVTHANVTALLVDALPLFGYRDDEVWPLVHGYGFDVSVWEMWAGIAAGARLISLDTATVASPPALAETLVRHRPTRLHIVPSVFRHLADAVVADALRINPRSVIFCGEALNYRAIQAWTDGVPGPVPQWVNVYGITETTVYNTFHEVTAAEIEHAPGATPIGRAYRSSPAVVLDAELRPVPPGETGEIFLGGAQVSPGYLNNPELTAQRFRTIDGRPGRWYRTGDLGCASADGVLHYAGRADDQVKVRGLRIELGEIDCALRQIPWVRDAAAIIEHTTRGDAVITACVVPSDDTVAHRATIGDLRAALARTVPEYMLPGTVAVLDRLPQNANGKTDRSALADQARLRRSGHATVSTPDHD